MVGCWRNVSGPTGKVVGENCGHQQESSDFLLQDKPGGFAEGAELDLSKSLCCLW